ncbi:biotin--[acetyl-CoA-carboxylase] ligase [Brachybacterium sp.]|uniref:biotin--[acetyl-CoA-carboxylase] ligase n=1 Tax=Brachybacterium sp. TaxID=1891286 RepID=UPI002ED405F8
MDSSDEVTPILRRDEVTSTQDEAVRLLADGARPPFALTARHQTRGRGRLGRPFSSPAGASLALTFVHRSRLAPERRGWLPLAAGLAAVTAIEQVLGEGAPDRIGLKWPNDLHTGDGRKLGGILVEARGEDLLMLGIGLNLRGPILQDDGQEVPGAAWLLGAGGLRQGGAARQGDAERDAAEGGARGAARSEELNGTAQLRHDLESALTAALAEELSRLELAGGDGVSAGTRERYTMTCLTVGHAVRVDPLGETGAGGTHPPSLHGIARTIDAHGRLVVDLAGGDQVAVDVGDVRHLRPDGPVRSTTRGATGTEQEEHGT